MTPDTPGTISLPLVMTTPKSPTPHPIPQQWPATRDEVGLGLGLGLGLGDDDEEEEELDAETETNTPWRLSERLDSMILEIQALTERGESALAATTTDSF